MKTIIISLILSIFLVSCSLAQTKPMKDSINKTKLVVKTDEEWKEILTEEEYQILRHKATERAFTGEYNKKYDAGIYLCGGCQYPLFYSNEKYDSGSGWPAYSDCIKNHVKEITDNSHGMERVEIVCARCDGHLGHVFKDGPTKTGLRYCVNSASLKFEEEE